MKTQIKLIQDLVDYEIETAENLRNMAREAMSEKDRERLYNEACENLSAAARLREHVINLIHILHVRRETT
mgnify:CR=1 FL=1